MDRGGFFFLKTEVGDSYYEGDPLLGPWAVVIGLARGWLLGSLRRRARPLTLSVPSKKGGAKGG